MRNTRFGLLLVGLLATCAAAASSIEVIQLRYRTAEELLPLVRPHLSQGSSATGAADRIIVRVQQSEIAELRSLLNELDQPPRAILVTVRRGSAASSGSSGFGVGGDARTGGRVRVYSSEAASNQQSERQIRGLEGRPLRIDTRTLLPMRETVAWLGTDTSGIAERTSFVELDGGLYALPRLVNGRVEIDLAVQDRAADEPLGTRSVVTTVSGPTGEWIPFASIDDTARSDDRGLIHRSERARRTADTLWIRVVPLD